MDGASGSHPETTSSKPSPVTASHKTVEQWLAETPADPPRSRGLRKLGIVGFVLLLLLGFAPQIISRTPLLGRLIALGTADLNGTVSCGSASLSWFSTPAASAIGLTDDQGRTVATAEEVSCDRGLWSLITAPKQLGRLRVDRPLLTLLVRADGTTNLEEVLKKFTEPLPPGVPSTKVAGAIEVVDGKAEVREEATGRSWSLDKLNGVVILPDGETPLSVDVKGTMILADGPRPWSCRLNWHDTAESGKPTAPQGDIALDVTALPLELVHTLAKRFLPGLDYAGLFSGKLIGKFDLAAEQPTAEIAGRLNVSRFALGGAKLQGDEVRLAQIDLPLKASVAENRLFVEQFSATCDLAGLQLSGSLADYRRLFTATGAMQLLNLLAQGDGQLQARVDLAKIGQAMPHVLRVRDDVQITGGEIVVSAVAGLDKTGVRRRQIDLNTSGLTALSKGAVVAWQQPLQATLAIADGAAGPMIDKLSCRSDFLAVDGVNSAKSFDVSARYSLALLMQRAEQFLDFEGVQLAGEGTAQGSWTYEAANRFNLAGTATIDGFRLLAPGYAPWTERQLVVGVQAVGSALGFMVTSIEQAAVGIQSEGDQLTLRTTQPSVDFANLQLVVPVSLEGRGRLDTWLARIRPFAGLPATMVAEGQAELTAVGKFRPYSDLEITQSTLRAQPLRIAGYGLAVDEPNGELTLVGRYTPKQTTIAEAKLMSPGTQMTVQNLTYTTPTGRPMELKGDVALNTELARLIVPTAAVAGAPAAAALPWQYAGLLNATAKLQQTGNVTAMSFETIVKDFAVGQGGVALWREPQVRLLGSGIYEPDRDLASIERLELAADAIRLMATGKLTELSGACVLDGRGEATYDLARLTPIAQPYVGQGFVMEGRETQPFQFAGPLVDTRPPGTGASNGIAWDKITAATRLGWDRINLYGVPIAKGNVDARLAQGVLRTSMIDVPISEGRVRISPALRVGPEPMELAIDPGLVIDHVTITPEMANERLKFVMPIMAGVAQVGGKFSMQVQEFRLPLHDPTAGSITGKLTVHDIEVGPGFIMQELASLVKIPSQARLTRESNVDFKMIQGRLYHQNLEFAFPEVTVRTSGSVGIADQSLSLVAEVALPAKLLGNLSAAGGQVVRVPIGGTLSKPKLDRQAFVQATAQVVEQAAQQALQKTLGRGETAAQEALNKGQNAAEQALGRGLNRLFGPGATNPTPGAGVR
ncbi:MAG: hypothetical protein K8U03_03385 [Planctomycetia bacterium]|nr:hypothetical protein [Planctomycetia bacterium]